MLFRSVGKNNRDQRSNFGPLELRAILGRFSSRLVRTTGPKGLLFITAHAFPFLPPLPQFPRRDAPPLAKPCSGDFRSPARPRPPPLPPPCSGAAPPSTSSAARIDRPRSRRRSPLARLAPAHRTRHAPGPTPASSPHVRRPDAGLTSPSSPRTPPEIGRAHV